MKVIHTVRAVVIILGILSLGGCGKSSNGSGGDNPPAQQVPTQPVINSPASGDISSNAVTVSWSWSTENGVNGSSWYILDTSGGNTFKSQEFTNITTTSGHQEASIAWTLNAANPQHTLKVELCNDAGCTDSSEVTVTISSNPPPVSVPVITAPADGLKTANPQQVFSWKFNSPTVINGCSAEFTRVTNGQQTKVSGICSTNNPGQQIGGLVFNLPQGVTTMTVRICSTDTGGNTSCSDPSEPVSITVGIMQKLIIGYYSNWTTYNNKLRHGDADDQYGPYGLSGTKYQYYTGDKIHTMTKNTDAERQVENLDYIDYAFVEAYPNKSVTFTCDANGANCAWAPITTPNFKYNSANAGKIYLSDPWSDLFDTEGQNSIAGTPSGLCAPNLVTSSVSDQTRHLLCLGAYETATSNGQGAIISDPEINSSSYADTYFQLGNFDQFSLLKKSNSNIKRIISIGGWANEATFEAGAFVNPQNFIDSVATLLNYTLSDGSTLDGVDLDYEPGQYDTNGYKIYADDFVKLVTALRNDSRMKGKTITVAVFADPAKMADFNGAGDGSDPKKGNWFKLSQVVNYISLMGYDFHGVFDNHGAGGVTNYQSNLYVGATPPGYGQYSDDKSIAALTDGMPHEDPKDSTLVGYGVPKSQIILGIPSYARVSPQVVANPYPNGIFDSFNGTCFQGDMDAACGDGQQSYYSLYYSENDITNIKTSTPTTLPSWQSQPGFMESTDSSGGNNYYGSYMFNTQTNIFAAYDTTLMAQSKAYYVGETDLGGMMMWELASDTPPGDANATSLLCKMASILHTSGCVTQ